MKLRIQKMDGRMIYFKMTDISFPGIPPRHLIVFGIDPKGIYRWTLPPHVKIKVVGNGRIAIED